MTETQTFTLIYLLLWFGRSVVAVLNQTYLWQLKEYRFDRLKEHIRSKKNFWPELAAKIFLLLIIPIIFSDILGPYILALASLFFFAEIIHSFYLFFARKFKKPHFTSKATLITLGSLMVPSGILAYSLLPPSAHLASGMDESIWYGTKLIFLPILLAFITPLFVALMVFSLKPFTFFAKKRIYAQATAKISQNPHLKVIGITGSYGKTSTKEFLSFILSRKYKVLKTDEHVNTEIGVAQTILRKLHPDHQIFVAEMGAYKKGEIFAICNIIKPKIGIVTALGPQHLGLFGSLKNILKTKWELIESLPSDGLAVINADNKFLKNRAKNLQISKIFFGMNKKADIFATKIKESNHGLEFYVQIGNQNQHFSTSLIGRHTILNILAAISVSSHLGMTLEEIAAAVKKIPQLPKTMQKIPGRNGLTIIDESYNANPDGIISALEYLKLFNKKKKVIVMPSMLELGEASKNEHQRVAKKIAEVCDYAIFLDKNHLETLKKGLNEVKNSHCQIYFQSKPQKIMDIFKNNIGYDSVILFESRGAENVIKALKKA